MFTYICTYIHIHTAKSQLLYTISSNQLQRLLRNRHIDKEFLHHQCVVTRPPWTKYSTCTSCPPLSPWLCLVPMILQTMDLNVLVHKVVSSSLNHQLSKPTGSNRNNEFISSVSLSSAATFKPCRWASPQLPLSKPPHQSG